MDGRRIIKAYGLEDHSIARVDARLSSAAEDPAEGGTAARRRRARHRHLRRAGDRAGAVRRRLAEPARPAHPQHLHRLHRGAAAGAAAGAQSQPALAHRLGRHRRRQRIFAAIDASPAIVDRPGAKPLRSRQRRRGALRAMSASPITTDGDATLAQRRPRYSRRARRSRWWGRRAPARAPSSICCCASTMSTAAAIAIDGQDIHGVTLRIPARRHRAGDPGSDPVRRKRRRQYRAGQARRHAGRDRGGGAQRRRA